MAKKTTIFIEATPLINRHMSGVGHVLLSTLKALDALAPSEYEVKIFVPFDEFHKLDRFEFSYVKKVRLPFPHKVLSLLTRLKYGIPLDLLLGKGTYVFPNFRNWNLARSPSITYIHDACFAIYPQYVQPLNLHFLQTYMPLWLSRTDKIVAISQSSRREIIDHLRVPEEHTTVVENTIDTELFHPYDDASISAVREKYALDKDYVLFVGNIEPRKNLEALLAAFRADPGNTAYTLFLVGGEGWLNQTVTDQIDAAVRDGFDIRRNPDFVPDEDIAVLMAGARVLALVSWHEGFGLPALEALHTGTPVIASDIPGLREALAGNDRSVTYVNPDDRAGLRQAINDAMAQPKRPFAAVPARSWDDAARELLQVVSETKRSRR